MHVNDPSGLESGGRRVMARDLALITLILAVFLPWGFSTPSIITRGEVREALVVRTIVEENHWVLPHRLDELPRKPPLFHWISAAGAKVLGLSDFTIRLPSVLAALAIAIATFCIGLHMGGRLVGWLSVGALLGTHQFWQSATEARVDMLLAACVTISIAGFFYWYRGGFRFGRTACYLGAALGVLAKGPLGLILPALVIIAFLAWEKRLERLRQLWSLPLVTAVLVIDLGW